MTYGGKTLQPILLVLGLFLLPFNAWSAITTEVDRTEVALGETLRLTIRSDAGEQPNDLDLSGIERDFEILQRSSSTSARLVGGQQSVTRTLELDLAPRRDGVMTIPPFGHRGQTNHTYCHQSLTRTHCGSRRRVGVVRQRRRQD